MFYWLKTIFAIQFAIVVCFYATIERQHAFQKNNQVVSQSSSSSQFSYSSYTSNYSYYGHIRYSSHSNDSELNQWESQDSTSSKPSSIPYTLLVGIHLDDDLNDHGDHEDEDSFGKDIADFQKASFVFKSNSKELYSNNNKNHEEPLLQIELPPPEFYKLI